MNSNQALDALDLNDDGIFDDEIRAVFPNDPSAICDRHMYLPREPESLFGQFDAECLFVRCFHKTWA